MQLLFEVDGIYLMEEVEEYNRHEQSKELFSP